MEKTVMSKDLALAVCKALSDKRGKDIVALYVREKTDLCDYFVIASGSNAPQIRAMGERVEELVEKRFEGSLPAFVAAFAKKKELKKEQIEEILRIIEEG